MIKKYASRTISLIMICVMCMGLFSGCSVSGSAEEETAQAVAAAVAEVNSCKTSVVFEMLARIGASSSSDGHTASIGSDITVSSTFEPFSCHAEYYSQILVDGVRSREDQEYYIAAENEDYVSYEYQQDTDEWHRNVLSRSESLALPLQTGLIQDWEAFFKGLKLEREEEIVNNHIVNIFSGTVSTNLIQELIGGKVFGSFLYSMEQLLSDSIPCTVNIDAETNLPVEITLDFSDAFIVSDMIIESGTISVSYSDWNSFSPIDVPKKISIVARDPEAEFYVSYFAWDLFLPYILGQGSNPSGQGSGGNVSFSSAWNTFQLRLDNHMTSIPISYQDLKTLGYYIDDHYTSTIIEPNSVVKNVPVLKNKDTVYCSFYNSDSSPQPISSCNIGSLDIIAADIIENGVSVFLPGEVTLGITLDSLLAAYGEADATTSGFAVDTYTWKGETENQSLYAEISPSTGLVIRICLTNIPLSAANTDSSSAEAPADASSEAAG